MWDEIAYPFPHFHGFTVEVWELISNFTPPFIMGEINHPYPDQSIPGYKREPRGVTIGRTEKANMILVLRAMCRATPIVTLRGAPSGKSLEWRHYGHDSVSNHQPHDCLLNPLLRRRSKKTSKLRVTGLCAGNSPGTGEFPAQMASNAENVSIWWRHHGIVASQYPSSRDDTLLQSTTIWMKKKYVTLSESDKDRYIYLQSKWLRNFICRIKRFHAGCTKVFKG